MVARSKSSGRKLSQMEVNSNSKTHCAKIILHIKTLADLLGLELSYFHSMIAFIGECELKTRDELPEHVLTGGMVSYVKKKQDEILTEDEVKSIVEQINSNRFSKSWRTNREHKAYLKDKHSNPSKNTNKQPSGNATDKPISEPIVKESAKRVTLKSREVLRWSGQTEIESSELLIDSLNTQQTNTPYVIMILLIKCFLHRLKL